MSKRACKNKFQKRPARRMYYQKNDKIEEEGDMHAACFVDFPSDVDEGDNLKEWCRNGEKEESQLTVGLEKTLSFKRRREDQSNQRLIEYHPE